MRPALMLLLAFCGSSCAPAPVLQLTALNTGSTWTQGRLETVEWADSLEWYVAFEGTERGYLVFAVSAWNGSSRVRLVDPSAFSCTLAPANGSAPSGLARLIPARDPERVLRDVSSRESSILASQRTADSFELIATLLGLADDLANGAKRTDEEQRRIDQERTERADQHEHNERERDEDLRALAQIRDAWSDGPLRRTVLSPGDSVAGRVYFPAHGFAGIPGTPWSGRSGRTWSIFEKEALRHDGWGLSLHVADGPNESVFRYSITRE